MNDPATFSLALPNEAATAHLMADLSLLVGAGDVITLSGDLGAGKTTAARAMIRHLAGDETLEGGALDDILVGRGGRDTVLYHGLREETQLLRQADGSWLAVGPDGLVIAGTATAPRRRPANVTLN